MTSGVVMNDIKENAPGMITLCPMCRYSLHGLPAKHTCPECGFRYDRNAYTASRPRVGLIIFVAANVALVLAGIGLWWWYGAAPRATTASMFVIVGLMYLVATSWRLARCKRFVLVSDDELRIFDARHQEQVFPMTQISDAKWSRTDGMVEVFAHGGAVLTRIPSSLLGSHRRSKTLATTITTFAGARDRGKPDGGNDQEKVSG